MGCPGAHPVGLGCPPGRAEDVVQEALAQCYRSWERVRRSRDVDAYVFTAVMNRWRTESRRAHRPVAPIAATGPADDLGLRLALEDVLAQLSREHREVLVLRYLADLSEAQTGEVLGIPVGTVKSRTRRALDTLQPLKEDLR